ncbi:hypothetical protein E3E23_03815 [Thermococcus sp. CX2]|uniref:hypothetical protein n=1 Tax=unclassified Thermococcus TaxID=2627626 RepID=UPI001431821E|nr:MULTISPECIES: hypothetical protein [unclassified Thermococcus]NJE42688.1 hypothetical protein [Thermococcus sp. GR6]NJE84957.1 hypothetical protein [Thermococcus sp. CX2]
MSENVIYLIAFILGALLSVLLVKTSMRKKWPLVGIFITLLLLFGACYGALVGNFYMVLVNLYLAALFVPELHKNIRIVKCSLVVMFGSLILILLEGNFIKAVAIIGIVSSLLEMYNWRNTKPAMESG